MTTQPDSEARSGVEAHSTKRLAIDAKPRAGGERVKRYVCDLRQGSY